MNKLAEMDMERGNTREKQQDLQQAAVLLGAGKADIYRLTTAASAWAKNTLSDILVFDIYLTFNIFGACDTELLTDVTMLEITQTEFMQPHRSKITATLVTQVNHLWALLDYLCTGEFMLNYL